jgi:hypothetical protein
LEIYFLVRVEKKAIFGYFLFCGTEFYHKPGEVISHPQDQQRIMFNLYLLQPFLPDG